MSVCVRQHRLEDRAMALPEKCLTQCKQQIGGCLEASATYWTLPSRYIPKLLCRNAKLLGYAAQRQWVRKSIKHLTRNNGPYLLFAQYERNCHMREASLVPYSHHTACPHGLRNRVTRNRIGDAKRASRPIMCSVMNQTPHRLRIVTFSQYVPIPIGECDGHSHGSAVCGQNFGPGVQIKQLGPQTGRELHIASCICEAPTFGRCYCEKGGQIDRKST